MSQNPLVCLRNASIKLKLNYRINKNTNKSDEKLVAITKIPNGQIFYEYSEGSERPFGAFASYSLGAIKSLPNGECQEISRLFLDFGFYNSPEDLLTKIDLFLSSISRDLCWAKMQTPSL